MFQRLALMQTACQALGALRSDFQWVLAASARRGVETWEQPGAAPGPTHFWWKFSGCFGCVVAFAAYFR